eukprot:Cvel_21370.t1-p1 / transcript=Cvel_21370.t1 / gene=Cvel_21370 / organism=Chromera_velia_CCMP2878 / gene_product=Signal peptide, CUB and EGF-like domain-containing, putative / transcript_product=Signal peptide, CUB and EGF-like domain-containing, putative / location=Cvel_scaffold1998:22925-35812(+) / protein_length=2640 / sequence_SO=supercontig / SO=protein_coding / is_pseudo=false
MVRLSSAWAWCLPLLLCDDVKLYAVNAKNRELWTSDVELSSWPSPAGVFKEETAQEENEEEEGPPCTPIHLLGIRASGPTSDELHEQRLIGSLEMFRWINDGQRVLPGFCLSVEWLDLLDASDAAVVSLKMAGQLLAPERKYAAVFQTVSAGLVVSSLSCSARLAVSGHGRETGPETCKDNFVSPGGMREGEIGRLRQALPPEGGLTSSSSSSSSASSLLRGDSQVVWEGDVPPSLLETFASGLRWIFLRTGWRRSAQIVVLPSEGSLFVSSLSESAGELASHGEALLGIQGVDLDMVIPLDSSGMSLGGSGRTTGGMWGEAGTGVEGGALGRLIASRRRIVIVWGDGQGTLNALCQLYLAGQKVIVIFPVPSAWWQYGETLPSDLREKCEPSVLVFFFEDSIGISSLSSGTKENNNRDLDALLPCTFNVTAREFAHSALGGPAVGALSPRAPVEEGLGGSELRADKKGVVEGGVGVVKEDELPSPVSSPDDTAAALMSSSERTKTESDTERATGSSADFGGLLQGAESACELALALRSYLNLDSQSDDDAEGALLRLIERDEASYLGFVSALNAVWEGGGDEEAIFSRKRGEVSQEEREADTVIEIRQIFRPSLEEEVGIALWESVKQVEERMEEDVIKGKEGERAEEVPEPPQQSGFPSRWRRRGNSVSDGWRNAEGSWMNLFGDGDVMGGEREGRGDSAERIEGRETKKSKFPNGTPADWKTLPFEALYRSVCSLTHTEGTGEEGGNSSLGIERLKPKDETACSLTFSFSFPSTTLSDPQSSSADVPSDLSKDVSLVSRRFLSPLTSPLLPSTNVTTPVTSIPDDLIPKCSDGLLMLNGVCQPCPAGLEASRLGLACVKCLAGHFSDPQRGITSCQPCEPSTHAPLEGSTFCVACPKGREAPSSGEPLCTPCKPGTYQDTEGGGDCKPCKPGEYQDEAGQLGCKQCPPFHVSHAASKGLSDCVCQRPNLHVQAESSWEKFRVEETPGYFNAGNRSNGQFLCLPCPAGAYCVGNLTAPLLLPGYFAYMPERYAGFQWDDEGNPILGVSEGGEEECESCGGTRTGLKGTNVPQDLLVDIPDDPTGSFETSALFVYWCRNKRECPGRLPGTCGLGRDSSRVSCGMCPAHSVASFGSGKCVECEGNEHLWIWPLFGLVTPMAYIIIYKLSNGGLKAQATHLSTFRIACRLFFWILQVATILASLRLSGPGLLRPLAKAGSVLRFDLEASRLKCGFMLEAFYREQEWFLLQTMGPLFLAGLGFFLYGASVVLSIVVGRPSLRMCPHKTVNTLGGIFSTIYTGIAAASMGVFRCEAHPGWESLMGHDPSEFGPTAEGGNAWAERKVRDLQAEVSSMQKTRGESLVLYPNVLCGSETYWTLFPIGLTAMLLYIVVWNIFVLYINSVAPRRTHNENFKVRFRFLFNSYRGRHWYWNFIEFLTGIFIAVVPTALPGHPLVAASIIAAGVFALASITLAVLPYKDHIINVVDVLARLLIGTEILFILGKTACEEAAMHSTGRRREFFNASVEIMNNIMATILCSLIAIVGLLILTSGFRALCDGAAELSAVDRARKVPPGGSSGGKEEEKKNLEGPEEIKQKRLPIRRRSTVSSALSTAVSSVSEVFAHKRLGGGKEAETSFSPVSPLREETERRKASMIVGTEVEERDLETFKGFQDSAPPPPPSHPQVPSPSETEGRPLVIVPLAPAPLPLILESEHEGGLTCSHASASASATHADDRGVVPPNEREREPPANHQFPPAPRPIVLEPQVNEPTGVPVLPSAQSDETIERGEDEMEKGVIGSQNEQTIRESENGEPGDSVCVQTYGFFRPFIDCLSRVSENERTKRHERDLGLTNDFLKTATLCLSLDVASWEEFWTRMNYYDRAVFKEMVDLLQAEMFGAIRASHGGDGAGKGGVSFCEGGLVGELQEESPTGEVAADRFASMGMSRHMSALSVSVSDLLIEGRGFPDLSPTGKVSSGMGSDSVDRSEGRRPARSRSMIPLHSPLASSLMCRDAQQAAGLGRSGLSLSGGKTDAMEEEEGAVLRQQPSGRRVQRRHTGGTSFLSMDIPPHQQQQKGARDQSSLLRAERPLRETFTYPLSPEREHPVPSHSLPSPALAVGSLEREAKKERERGPPLGGVEAPRRLHAGERLPLGSNLSFGDRGTPPFASGDLSIFASSRVQQQQPGGLQTGTSRSRRTTRGGSRGSEGGGFCCSGCIGTEPPSQTCRSEEEQGRSLSPLRRSSQPESCPSVGGVSLSHCSVGAGGTLEVKGGGSQNGSIPRSRGSNRHRTGDSGFSGEASPLRGEADSRRDTRASASNAELKRMALASAMHTCPLCTQAINVTPAVVAASRSHTASPIQEGERRKIRSTINHRSGSMPTPPHLRRPSLGGMDSSLADLWEKKGWGATGVLSKGAAPRMVYQTPPSPAISRAQGAGKRNPPAATCSGAVAAVKSPPDKDHGHSGSFPSTAAERDRSSISGRNRSNPPQAQGQREGEGESRTLMRSLRGGMRRLRLGDSFLRDRPGRENSSHTPGPSPSPQPPLEHEFPSSFFTSFSSQPATLLSFPPQAPPPSAGAPPSTQGPGAQLRIQRDEQRADPLPQSSSSSFRHRTEVPLPGDASHVRGQGALSAAASAEGKRPQEEGEEEE